MIIAVDIDDVLYPSREAAIKRTNDIYGTAYHSRDSQWGFADMSPFYAWTTLRHFRKPRFIRSLRPDPRARKFVKELSKLGEVYLVSATYPEVMTERARAVARHMNVAEDRIVFLRDKHLFKADILIDDNADNLRDFPGIAIRYLQNWNVGVEADYTATSLEEVLEICKELTSA